jgi:hypothetical protein
MIIRIFFSASMDDSGSAPKTTISASNPLRIAPVRRSISSSFAAFDVIALIASIFGTPISARPAALSAIVACPESN